MRFLLRWFGTLIAACATIAFGIVAHYADASNGPEILITLTGVLLTLLIYVNDLREANHETRIDLLKKSLDDYFGRSDRLNNLLDRLRQKIGYDLTPVMLGAPNHMLDSCDRLIERSQHLENEAEIYAKLTDLMKGLNKNETAYCSCGKKNLGIPGEGMPHAYFKENIEAQNRGAKIHRVFRAWDNEIQSYAQEQKAAGIQVHKLPIDSKWKKEWPDETFGFAVFRAHTIVVHWGRGRSARGIVVYEDALLAGYFRSLYKLQYEDGEDI